MMLWLSCVNCANELVIFARCPLQPTVFLELLQFRAFKMPLSFLCNRMHIERHFKLRTTVPFKSFDPDTKCFSFVSVLAKRTCPWII